MALLGSAPVLAQALRNALLAEPATGAVDNEALTAFCSVMAEEIVNHLLTNAVVSPIGVPPMSNTGGPVAGFGVLT